MLWTDDKIAFIQSRWSGGESASQIAKGVFDKYGDPITRSAVIGKLYRTNAPKRESDAARMASRVNGRNAAKRNRKGRQPINKEFIRHKPERLPEFVETVTPLNVPLLEATQFQCRAITDDSVWGKAKCCGHETVGERPWCAGHLVRFTVVIAPKRRTPRGHDYARREDYRDAVRWAAR